MAKAVLMIDGDNVTGNYADSIMENAAHYGEITEAFMFSTYRDDKVVYNGKPVNPKYGDKGWTAEILYRHAIQPQIVPVLAADTSATDMAIAVHAMETLFEKPDTEVFIIATSDKDFMPLSMRLRNLGKTTVVLHREPNCRTCDAFTYAQLISKAQTDISDDYRETADLIFKFLEDKCSKNEKRRCNLKSLGEFLNSKDIDLRKWTKLKGTITNVPKLFETFPEFAGKFTFKLTRNSGSSYIYLR